MRLRTLALAAAAAISIVPVTSHAGNPEDCDSPIDLRSGSVIISPSNSFNCDGLEEGAFTYSPVFPGGNADVLLTGVVAPINGNRFTGTGSYLEYESAGLTGGTRTVRTYLTWSQAQGLTGPLAGRFESQDLSFGARDSVTAGPIKIVMWDAIEDPLNPTQCHETLGCYTVYERTFQTATNWADGV